MMGNDGRKMLLWIYTKKHGNTTPTIWSKFFLTKDGRIQGSWVGAESWLVVINHDGNWSSSSDSGEGMQSLHGGTVRRDCPLNCRLSSMIIWCPNAFHILNPTPCFVNFQASCRGLSAVAEYFIASVQIPLNNPAHNIFYISPSRSFLRFYKLVLETKT
jgi:hypothetical protein